MYNTFDLHVYNNGENTLKVHIFCGVLNMKNLQFNRIVFVNLIYLYSFLINDNEKYRA